MDAVTCVACAHGVRCQEPGCENLPTFGDSSRWYAVVCKLHKREDHVLVVGRRCETVGCPVRTLASSLCVLKMSQLRRAKLLMVGDSSRLLRPAWHSARPTRSYAPGDIHVFEYPHTHATMNS